MLRYSTLFITLFAATPASAFSSTTPFVTPRTTVTTLSMTANEGGERVVTNDGNTHPDMVKDSAKENLTDKAVNVVKSVGDKLTPAPGFGTQAMIVNDDGITSPDMVKKDAKGREAFGGSSSDSSNKTPIDKIGEKLSEAADSLTGKE